ncbi:MAG: metallophosphoesterase [Acidimicrobiia bacterium]|nr:metallophosphoesterase [Acidimicrobiia bacterium]
MNFSGSPTGRQQHPSSSFRFVFLADTQLGCYATFSGLSEEQVAHFESLGIRVDRVPSVDGFEWDARQYRRAVQVINAARPAFVAIGGDLVDDANSEDQINEFLAITADIDPEVPVHFIPGNHDITFDTVSPTPASMAAYRDVFGRDYYSFVYGDTLFITLNTPVIDRPEHVPDEWEGQLGFLQDELDQAARRRTGNVIIMGHHPLFLDTADEEDSYWNLPLERRATLLDLLTRSGVRIGFAGHYHRNATASDGGFTQVTSGPVGYPLGVDPSGYRLVEISDSKVTHAYHALSDT